MWWQFALLLTDENTEVKKTLYINKKGSSTGIIAVVAVLLIGAIAFGFGSGTLSLPGMSDAASEDGVWSDSLVKLTVTSKDAYTGTSQDPSIKLYADQPADWGNPRGSFSDSANYESYSLSSGTVDIQEYPGTYYGVVTLSNYHTEFVELTVPNGNNFDGTLSEYNQAPNAVRVEMAAQSALTTENVLLTLTNVSDREITKFAYQTTDADQEFRGWKVIVKDIEGFSTDADGDGIYDEGIKKLEVSVCGVSKNIFEPAKGIDEFDTNDEYEFSIPSCVEGDESTIPLKVEITADTADVVSANDGKLGEGEGQIATFRFFDNEGSLQGTAEITA